MHEKVLQYVQEERASERAAVVENVVDGADRRQVTRLQGIRDARAVQAVVGISREPVPVEPVAARFRNQVNLDAAELELGRVAAQLNGDLLRGRRSEIEPGAGVGRF